MKTPKIKTAKTKVEAANLPVPQNEVEAVETIRHIGDAAREMERIAAECAAATNAIIADAAKATLPLKRKHDELTEGLKIWCEANRERLTKSGRIKTVEFATGVIAWRHRPPKVTLREKVDVIIERIRALNLADRFLRATVELNKEAMLTHPDLARTIQGVSVGSSGEDFIVEPFKPEMPEVA